jgi:hypothetical protein
MRDTEAILDVTGVGKALEPLSGVRFQDLNVDDAHEVQRPNQAARDPDFAHPCSKQTSWSRCRR